jgi:hypothetical protein
MSMQVAQTILDQLGGRQFLMMVGGKDLVSLSGDGGLALKFGSGARNKANRVRVEYDYGSDTYNVEFGKIFKHEWKTVSRHEGIYADMLQDLFTSETGFYTSLR